MRIGIGYDIHKLVEGRDLILAGVKVPYDRGLYGHSDADIVFHSIADSLLGAMAKGDIGSLFPDTDEDNRGMNSSTILSKVFEIMIEENYSIENIDINIIAEKPRLSTFREAMIYNIANILNISNTQISIKMRTNETLDAVGKSEAMICQCICLLTNF